MVFGILKFCVTLPSLVRDQEENLETYTIAYCKLRLGDAVTRSDSDFGTPSVGLGVESLGRRNFDWPSGRLVAALAECDIFTENQLLEAWFLNVYL